MSASFSSATTNTPRLGLPLMAPAQALKHITHNEALLALDQRVRHVGEGGLPSLCHNSQFTVWQRGYQFTESGPDDRLTFTADRWAVSLLADGANRAEKYDSPVGPALGLFRTTGGSLALGSSNSQCIAQVLPTDESRNLAGQRVVLSWLLEAGADLSASSVRVRVFSGQGIDEGVSALIDGQWTGQRVLADAQFATDGGYNVRNYVTAEVPDLTEGLSQIGVIFEWEPDTLSPSDPVSGDDGLCLADVRLQMADAPAPLSRIDPAAELAECERFFQVRGFLSGEALQSGVSQHYQAFTAISSSALRAFLPLSRVMRRIPDITFMRGALTAGPDETWNLFSGDWVAGHSMTVEQNRPDGFVTQIGFSGSTLTPGFSHLCNGAWTADSEMY